MISRAALAARSCWTRAHLLLERIASIGGGARPLEGEVASRDGVLCLWMVTVVTPLRPGTRARP